VEMLKEVLTSSASGGDWLGKGLHDSRGNIVPLPLLQGLLSFGFFV